MDWSKAKRVAIFILVIVNIILLGLNYKKDREYELTAAQEKAVFSIMAANGINIYTELVSNYAPMSSINVSIPEINPEIFLKMMM